MNRFRKYILTGFMFLAFISVVIANTANAAGAIATAKVSGGLRYYKVINQVSENAAKKMAMTDCIAGKKKNNHVGKCEIALSAAGPAYWAIFHADNGSVGFGASSDRQDAIDGAYQECSKLGPCPSTAAEVLFDEGQNPKKHVAKNTQKQCSPPAGKTVRYSDKCTNGDCTRTFENGCSIRFQAAYCHNPFTGDWEWKPDGCN